MADEPMKSDLYDADGNIQIPMEQVLDKLSAELAQKTYENAQLKVVIDLLQKELQGIQNLVK